MRSVTGFVLLLTGLGVGAYAYYPETVERHVHLARVTRILSPVPTASGVSADQETRSFSPGSPLLGTGPTPPEATTVIAGRSATGSSELVRPSSSWHTVVSPALPLPSAQPRSGSTTPKDDAARYALIRDLQRELRRTGCYGGEIDSDWGGATKRSLADFLRRVNASLPLDQPDYVQLALLQSHAGDVCTGSQVAGAAAAAAAVRQVLAAPAPRVSRHAGGEELASTTGGDATMPAPPAPLLAARPSLPGRMSVGARPEAEGEARLFPTPEGRHPITGPVQDPRQTAAYSPSYSGEPSVNRPGRRAARPRQASPTAPPSRGIDRQSSGSKVASRNKAARQRALMRQAFGDAFN